METVLTILVIDDEPFFRALLQEVLEAEGYRVFTAASGEEGLDQAHRVKPAVILLNVLMPRLDGFEVCARLKRDPATQPIPVVLLTASEDPKLYAKAVQAGATMVLPKTTPPERLLHGIELVLPRPNSPPQDLD